MDSSMRNGCWGNMGSFARVVFSGIVLHVTQSDAHSLKTVCRRRLAADPAQKVNQRDFH